MIRRKLARRVEWYFTISQFINFSDIIPKLQLGNSLCLLIQSQKTNKYLHNELEISTCVNERDCRRHVFINKKLLVTCVTVKCLVCQTLNWWYFAVVGYRDLNLKRIIYLRKISIQCHKKTCPYFCLFLLLKSV